jgi:hypothetical protein
VLNVWLDHGVTISVQIWRVVRKRCCLSLIPFNVHRVYLTKEALRDFGDFKMGGQRTSNSHCEICRWHCATS